MSRCLSVTGLYLPLHRPVSSVDVVRLPAGSLYRDSAVGCFFQLLTVETLRPFSCWTCPWPLTRLITIFCCGNWVWVSGTLMWFRSYWSDRTYKVCAPWSYEFCDSVLSLGLRLYSRFGARVWIMLKIADFATLILKKLFIVTSDLRRMFSVRRRTVCVERVAAGVCLMRSIMDLSFSQDLMWCNTARR
jgi:hypothetical protein